jgi:Zn-finger nucleic acid-binding protein
LQLKCLDCKTSLLPKRYKGELWYSCQTCAASFASVQSFATVLNEYEFNKLKAEIRRAQILSTDHCPQCQKQMMKVIDLVKINHVEACTSCQMVWLDPGEGEKIKRDQQADAATEKKIQLMETPPVDHFAFIADGLNEPVHTPAGSSFIFILNSVVKALGLGYFAKQYPLLTFIIFIAIIVALAAFFVFNPGLLYILWLARVVTG